MESLPPITMSQPRKVFSTTLLGEGKRRELGREEGGKEEKKDSLLLTDLRREEKGSQRRSILGADLGSAMGISMEDEQHNASHRIEQESRAVKQLVYGDKITMYSKHKECYYIGCDGIATNRVTFNKEDKDVFMVVPANQNRMLGRLYGDTRKYQRDTEQAKEEEMMKKEEAYRQEVPQEIMDNWRHHQAIFGKPVGYNDVVQLVHLKTQQYVRVSKKIDLSAGQELTSASTTAGMPNVKEDFLRVYSLKLSSHSGQETEFIFKPCFKYQENDNILTQDSFYLGFNDEDLLNKCFYLYFSFPFTVPDTHRQFNFYFSEEQKSPLQFEIFDDSYVGSHMFCKLVNKAVWITHIEKPLYLSLKRIEKLTDQDENELGDFIEPADEAATQAFSLSFQNYDPFQPITCDGLWIAEAAVDRPNEIIIRHILYSVKLKPLRLEQLVRTDTEEGTISEGSIIKLSAKTTPTSRSYIELKAYLNSEGGTGHGDARSLIVEPTKVVRKLTSSNTVDDYFRSFKVLAVGEEQQSVVFTLANLAQFVRTFDMESAKRYSDFTEEAMLRILSKALKKLKQLCINSLVNTIQPLQPYKEPIESLQKLIKDMGCIDSVATLLLKLFPGGASVDYTENELMRRLIGQLLTLISISVKNNKENKMYTFHKTMRIIQKYIGLHLQKHQEDKALLSVVENCEEILLDSSLEHIINQFVRELANKTFQEKMKKNEILQILRIFCVNDGKGINSTQDLLHNILFETEIGNSVLLFFKFNSRENLELILKVENDEEINCCKDWSDSKEKSDTLHYFKNQLYLFSDMIHQNDKILRSVKEFFPIEALIANLCNYALSPVARTGLVRIFTSIFMNTERRFLTKKPRTQRVWDDVNCGAAWKTPTYMTSEQLEQIKALIVRHFKENVGETDLWLPYEYLRLISYMLNNDFLLGEIPSKEDWVGRMQEIYDLFSTIFQFCVHQLRMSEKEQEIARKRTTTGNLSQIYDESEETQETQASHENITPEQLAKAPQYLKFPLQYFFIFQSIASGEKREDLYQSYNKEIKVLLEEEICSFITQLIHFVHDGYLTSFTDMFYRCHSLDKSYLFQEGERFAIQLFSEGKEMAVGGLMSEVLDALKYKDIKYLYDKTLMDEEETEGKSFSTLLINKFIVAKDERLQNLLLKVLIGSQFKWSEFGRFLENLFIIMHDSCKRKQDSIVKVLQDLKDLINHSTNSLNVSDIKNLKQVSQYLSKFKNILTDLCLHFSAHEVEYDRGLITSRKKLVEQVTSIDPIIAKYFLKTKGYLVLLDFFKLCENVKKEAAKNVLEGHENLGLHAVTISRELLQVMELCTQILIFFVTTEPKAKIPLLKYIPRIRLIPPPKDKKNAEKWELFSELTASDIALINYICRDNTKIAYLNNKQIVYFKSLVTTLNESICTQNIDKVFEVFESIMDQTTHDGLYKDILGFFWENKRHIVIKNVLEYDEMTSERELEKYQQLVKISHLLASSPDLKLARLKLKDIFPLELLVPIYAKLYSLYNATLKGEYSNLLLKCVQTYGEVYFDAWYNLEEINEHFINLFVVAEEKVRDKDTMTSDEIAFYRGMYELYKQYEHWRLKYGSAKDFRLISSTFARTLTQTLSQAGRRMSDIDERKMQISSLLDETSGPETPDVDTFRSSAKGLLLSKVKLIYEKEVKNKNMMKQMQKHILSNQNLRTGLAEESNRFSKILLKYLHSAGNLAPQTREEKAEKEKGKLLILKIIEYIGRCNKGATHLRTTKYLIMNIIGVIDLAGNDAETSKGKKKAKKKVLLTLDNLKLTKTLLSLLCSDESEELDAILPAIMKLANRMLTTPIKKIQDQFYREFTSNYKSEKLFERMSTSINRNIFIHKWHPKMFAMCKRIKIFQTIEKIDIQKQILRFVKLLCVNSHEPLQLFITRQPCFKTGYNMIELMVAYLKTLVEEMKDVNAKSFSELLSEEATYSKRKKLAYTHAIASLHALSESLQGPRRENQEAIGNSDFLNIANEIMQLKFNFSSSQTQSVKATFTNHELCKIKDECSKLLLGLLEQREIDDSIVVKMRYIIKESTLVDNIKFVHFSFQKETDGNYTDKLLFEQVAREEQSNNFVLALGFHLHFVAKKLNELSTGYASTYQEVLRKKQSKVTEIKTNELGFFGSLVEFCFDLVYGFVYLFSKAVKNVVLQREKFEALKQSKNYSKECIKFFEYYTGTIEIVRNRKTEIVHFPLLPYAEAITERQQENIVAEMPTGQTKAKLDFFFHDCTDNLQTMKNEHFFAKTFRFYPVMGAVAKHLELWRSLAFYTAIMINVIMLFSYRKKEKGFVDHLDDPTLFDYFSVEVTSRLIDTLGIFNCIFAAIEVVSFLFKHIPSIYNKTKQKFDDAAERQASSLEIIKLKAEFVGSMLYGLFSNPQLYATLAYFILGVCGSTIHPLFFSYHLLTVIFRYQKLVAVLQAIWQPINEIILTLLLYIIIEFVFSVLSFYFFPQDYQSNTCYSLLSCFVVTLDQTFKNDGGVGSFMKDVYKVDQEKETVSFDAGRIIYDQLFNFVLLILIIQILAGLIIDKFGEIRENSEKKEEELKSTCIICGEKGDIIERRTEKTFDQHKDEVHNLWNYLLFIGYIKEKPRRELNGIEGYVYRCFKEEDISWLPYSLWEGEDEEEDKDKLEELVRKVLDDIETII